MTAPVTQRSLTLKGWGLLLLLALIWGGSFTANHAALVQMPVATVVAFRVTGAAIVLWAYIAIARLPVPKTWAFARSAGTARAAGAPPGDGGGATGGPSV